MQIPPSHPPRRRRRPIHSNQLSRFRNRSRHRRNILQCNSLHLLLPAQLTRQPLVLKEILNKRLLDCDCRHVSEDDEGGGDLAQAEGLGGVGEAVGGVGGARFDLAEELAVCEHGRCEDVGGPVDARGVEDGLVEDVVVAEVGVAAGERGVVLEDVVPVKVVTGKRVLGMML